MTAADLVPPITHEMGRHWDQPERQHIVIDRQGRALVPRRVFERLAEYSSSLPSGVYEGKMWKRHELVAVDDYGSLRPVVPDRWWLCWYGSGNDPNKCTVNRREILLLERT